MTNSISNSAYYYDRIRFIISEMKAADVIPPLLFSDTYAILQSVINTLATEDKRYFANYSAKSNFVLNEYGFSAECIKKNVLAYRFYLNIKNAVTVPFITHDDLDFIIYLCTEIITKVTDESIPEDILKSLNPNAMLSSFARAKLTQSNEIKEITLQVIEREKTDNLVQDFHCMTQSGEEVIVRFYDIWTDVSKIIWKNARITLFNVQYKIAETKYITVGKTSLLAIEPDFMIDATDIAECFDNQGYNIYIHFLKRFTSSGISQSLITGSIVNSIFDDLISENNIDFNSAYTNAVRTRLISCYALALTSNGSTRDIRSKVGLHFENIKRILPEFEKGILSIEPAFISPVYGIKGRLDLMQEFDDSGKKNIIELKSGKPPSLNYFYNKGNNSVKTGLWMNNLAQTTCYNLLLDSAFDDRTGNSQVFYSATSDHALRNAPSIDKNKQEVLIVRNWITALERKIALGNLSILDALQPDTIGLIPPFMQKTVQEFAANIQDLDAIERAYYEENISFIYREIFAQNIGAFTADAERAAATTWNNDSAIQNSNSLSDLILDKEKSDFEKGYIYLNIQNEQNSSIRKADALILYPTDEGRELYKNQILKCAVKEIANDFVLVTLRNKMLNIGFFEKYEQWKLIPDNSDNNAKKNISVLSNILSADRQKRQLLLGRREPQKRAIDFAGYPDLNELQNKLLINAVSADDYFILQGPPGTGKTSYMLKYMVKYIYENTDDNILLMAYTNQAVDEICSAIASISEAFEYYRFGSKESSRHKNRLLSELGASADVNQLFKQVQSCRVFCATTAFAVNNQEIFELKDFNIAIVDEAAQIIESQLVGLLAKVDRFVMIGDEKQLPAICIQAPVFQKCSRESLAEIELEKLSGSLFARLIKMCQKNDWAEAFGMLEQQARMHTEIQEFPSKFFYDNRLRVFDEERQESNERLFDPNSADELEAYLSTSRTILLKSAREPYMKMNVGEAKTIAKIVRHITDKYGQAYAIENIGIIAPFRLQCATIRKNLSEELRDKIIVDTVERFQGSQRNIIIISLCVNHLFEMEKIVSPYEIDGVLIDRKLNVSVTRAAEQLIILGNTDIMSSDPVYKKLVDYHRERHSLFQLRGK